MANANSQVSHYAKIKLELRKSTYLPGKVVSGKILLQVFTPFEPKTLYIQLSGREKTFWHEMFFENKQIPNREYMPRMSSINHHGENKNIVKETFPVCEWESELAAGGHSIPFKLKIPEDLPGSISYENHPIKAEIYYKITAFIETPKKLSDTLPITIRQRPFDQSNYKLDPPVTTVRSFCNKTNNQIKLSISQPYQPYNPKKDLRFIVGVNSKRSKIGLKGLKWKIYYMVVLRETMRDGKENIFYSCKPILEGKINKKFMAGTVAEDENGVEVAVSGFKEYIMKNPLVKSDLVESGIYIVVSGIVDVSFSCFAEGPSVMDYLLIKPCVDGSAVIPEKPKDWEPVEYHTIHLNEKVDTDT